MPEKLWPIPVANCTPVNGATTGVKFEGFEESAAGRFACACTKSAFVAVALLGGGGAPTSCVVGPTCGTPPTSTTVPSLGMSLPGGASRLPALSTESATNVYVWPNC